MVSKNFQQELLSLRSGLAELNKIIRETESREKMDRALRAREFQTERIVWFAKGYHLKEREEKAQGNLL